MPHDEEGVKSNSNRHNKFIMRDCLNCGQPSSFSRVEEKENHVVLFDQLFKLFGLLLEAFVSLGV
jgi:hypothetical protein